MEHSRTPSAGSTASNSSYQMILEHVLQYQASYEIPIRTMYALNVAQAQQHAPKGRRPPSPTSPTSQAQQQDTTAQFTASLMAQISKLPTHACSLPTSFTTRYVRDCFPADFASIDFSAALTALDYLNDLERRRRKDLAAALAEVGVDAAKHNVGELAQHSPECAEWVNDICDRDQKSESLYAQVYIALRRWVLINELSLEPYNKSNCFAMLNTLYPPIVSVAPSRLLTAEVLNKQRHQFMRYIQAVEKNGVKVLQSLTEQHRETGDPNGWRSVNTTLEKYLVMANDSVTRCQDVILHRREFKQEKPIVEDAEKRGGRKTDSGVSFGARPSTGMSISSTAASFDHKSGPHSPLADSASASFHSFHSSKGGSLLENIAKEWKKLKGKKVTEIIPPKEAPTPVQQDKLSKGLRKMRSLGNLSDLRLRNSSVTSFAGRPAQATIPEFDEQQMKQERSRYEAKRPGVPTSKLAS